MTSSLRMWLNPHFLVKWCLFKCHLWVGKKNIQPAKRRFDRRIGQLYDDLRRADFQGDKDAVASWTEEVLGLQRLSKKGTVFNDETRRGVEILKDVFQKHMMSVVLFLFFQFELWEFLIFEVQHFETTYLYFIFWQFSDSKPACQHHF